MKTKIDWRHGNKTLKLADPTHPFPEIGEIVGLNGGLYRVTGVESAVVTVEEAEQEAIGPADPEVAETKARPPTADLQSARTRTADRLSAEKSVETKRSVFSSFVPSKKKK